MERVSAYTMTYYPNYNNGGNAVVVSVTPNTYNATVENPFTRSGYTFDGWNSKEDGTGTNYGTKQSIYILENMTFYAKWKAN